MMNKPFYINKLKVTLLKRIKIIEFSRLCFLTVVFGSSLVSCGHSDKARARGFANDVSIWSQKLTANGRKTGSIIYGLIEADETDFNVLKLHLKENNEYIASGIDHFSNTKLPSYAEGYRSAVLDYLQWQISSKEEVMPKAMAIVADQNLPRNEKAKRVKNLFDSFKQQEQEWQAKLKTSYDTSIP